MLHAAVLAIALNTMVSAQSRCNDLNATQLQDRLRADERAVPAPDQRDARFADLQSIAKSASDEELILQSVCSESDLIPLSSTLLALQAWSLALQSDLAFVEYGEQCPAAKNAVTGGFVAAAWLDLADGRRSNPHPPGLLATVEAKVRTRAAAVGLTLPAVADTSNYWMTRVQEAGRDAAKACQQ